MNPRTHDIGAYIKGAAALPGQTITSSTSSGVEQDGTSFDRQSLTYLYRSCKVIVPVSASLDAAATLTIAGNLQDSTSGSTWVDYSNKNGVVSTSAVFGTTASTAAQTINDVFEFDVDLGAARRYIRCQVTPTLSAPASTTDSVDLAGVFVLGGPPVLPSQ